MTLQQIDSLCDKFETALRKGDTVRIEDVLPKIEESQRSALLKELLEVEIQFAVKRPPADDSLRNTQESLQQRFPDELDLIQSLFQRFTQLQQIGDYEILGELGRGGMGVVYKAKHKLLQQTVAIKVLSQALLDDSQAIGRFKREMQLIGGLTHPNIVRALNAGETNGTHYLAMEFVEGITLQKLVEIMQEKSGSTTENVTGSVSPPLLPVIPLGAACEAIRQAALGLQDVHELKLVHRDIKPANLMLDHRGTVKILDLGLGKFAEEYRQDYHSSLTVPGMVIGTVDYISPEQCEHSGEADIRSDLYSLGCTLYFLLTGKPVYSGSRYDTMRKKLMAHIVSEVPSLKRAIPDLPPAIESILQKVLAKDPAERFQTPIEFAEALIPFASPGELWTLIHNIMPVDITASRSSSRYSSSPYAFAQTQNSLGSTVKRPKWTPHLMSLCFLFAAAVIGVILYYLISQIIPLWRAVHAEENARKFCEQWNISEARAENQKAVQLRAAVYLRTGYACVQQLLFQSQINSAVLRWYHGETSGARRDLQTVLESIDQAMSNDPANLELAALKMLGRERLADFTLFGGAASARVTERQIESGIDRYGEAARLGANDPRYNVIRWKQSMLLAIQGNVEQTAKLLADNPLPEGADVYAVLVRQLAEAMLFYFQRASNDVAGTDPTQGFEAFMRDFPRSARGMTGKPEFVELWLLNAELWIYYGSIKRENWRTLANVLTRSNAVAGFLRQNPGGSLPFVRRFYELLVQSAVLLYEQLELPEDKQWQIETIVRILDRMRPSEGERGVVETERPALIYFFLPEANIGGATGFVIFYPQNVQEWMIYPLPLTRQTVLRGDVGNIPPLDARLLKQIEAEKALGRRIRISWSDKAVWANAVDALTDANYPYKDVLPLR